MSLQFRTGVPVPKLASIISQIADASEQPVMIITFSMQFLIRFNKSIPRRRENRVPVPKVKLT